MEKKGNKKTAKDLDKFFFFFGICSLIDLFFLLFRFCPLIFPSCHFMVIVLFRAVHVSDLS